MYNNHPWDQKTLVVVDNWSIFREILNLWSKSSIRNLYRSVLVLWRWSLAQVWLPIKSVKFESNFTFWKLKQLQSGHHFKATSNLSVSLKKSRKFLKSLDCTTTCQNIHNTKKHLEAREREGLEICQIERVKIYEVAKKCCSIISNWIFTFFSKNAKMEHAKAWSVVQNYLLYIKVWNLGIHCHSKLKGKILFLLFIYLFISNTVLYISVILRKKRISRKLKNEKVKSACVRVCVYVKESVRNKKRQSAHF